MSFKKLKSMKRMYKTYWTIWAIGYHRIPDFRNETIEFKIFIGPLVITFWR